MIIFVPGLFKKKSTKTITGFNDVAFKNFGNGESGKVSEQAFDVLDFRNSNIGYLPNA